ncbi:MAG: outer membrane beta-barrel protein [Legionella longbeachae]|nr:outer membrane beta-barrel protein [Legionella longbeachae]
MNCRLTLVVLLSSIFNNLFAGSMGSIPTTFGGFYAGLGTGFTTVFSNDEYTVNRPGFGVVRSGTNKVSDSAILFSGQLGYGTSLNKNIYLGGKASVYYTPMESFHQNSYASPRGPNQLAAGQDSLSRTFKPIYNIDAVLGYEMFPNLMPFVEAGVSFANVKHAIILDGSIVILNANLVDHYTGAFNVDGYKTGYNVGIGANYLAYKNWIISGELVYHDLGKNNLSTVINTSILSIPANHFRKETNQAATLLATVSYLIPN